MSQSEAEIGSHTIGKKAYAFYKQCSDQGCQDKMNLPFLEGPVSGTTKPRRPDEDESTCNGFRIENIVPVFMNGFDAKLTQLQNNRDLLDDESFRVLAWLAGYNSLAEDLENWNWETYLKELQKHLGTLFPEFIELIQDIVDNPDDEVLKNNVIAELRRSNVLDRLSIEKGYASLSVLKELEKPPIDRNYIKAIQRAARKRLLVGVMEEKLGKWRLPENI